MMERRKALDGRSPSAARSASARRSSCPTPRSRSPSCAPGRATRRSVDHDGVHRLLRNLCRDERFGPRRGADHPRRGPHLRHGRAVPRVRRSTPRRARSTSRSTTTCCSPTPRTPNGQILEEGITEAGSMASFIAAGTSVRDRGVPMVPFYTFYSMFGFQRSATSSGRRPTARPRLPDGRHRRPHHPARRGSAAPGRPQPRARLDRAGVQAYDPAFAYEVGAIVGARPDRMYGPGPPSHDRRLLLPHHVQRELRDAGAPRHVPSSTEADRARALPLGRRTRGHPSGHDPVLRFGARRRPRRRRRARRALRRRPSSCGPPPRTRRCAKRRWPSSAGTACTRRRSARRRS
jgi:hypothetical protein